MKIYEAPSVEITKLEVMDLPTVSTGDSPYGDGYEW